MSTLKGGSILYLSASKKGVYPAEHTRTPFQWECPPGGPTDLTFNTHFKDQPISYWFEGQGQRSRLKMKKIQFSAWYQDWWSKIKVTRVKVKVTKVDVIGQGHKSQGQRSRSKCNIFIFNVLLREFSYPVNSREVRHAVSIFIGCCFCLLGSHTLAKL